MPFIVPQLIIAGAVPACRVEAPGLAPAPGDSSFGRTCLPKPVLRPENWGCSLGLRVSLCSQADGSERPWTNSSLEARLFSTLCVCLGQSPREPLKQNTFFPLLPPSLPTKPVLHARCQPVTGCHRGIHSCMVYLNPLPSTELGLSGRDSA